MTRSFYTFPHPPYAIKRSSIWNPIFVLSKKKILRSITLYKKSEDTVKHAGIDKFNVGYTHIYTHSR